MDEGLENIIRVSEFFGLPLALSSGFWGYIETSGRLAELDRIVSGMKSGSKPEVPYDDLYARTTPAYHTLLRSKRLRKSLGIENKVEHADRHDFKEFIRGPSNFYAGIGLGFITLLGGPGMGSAAALFIKAGYKVGEKAAILGYSRHVSKRRKAERWKDPKHAEEMLQDALSMYMGSAEYGNLRPGGPSLLSPSLPGNADDGFMFSFKYDALGMCMGDDNHQMHISSGSRTLAIGYSRSQNLFYSSLKGSYMEGNEMFIKSETFTSTSPFYAASNLKGHIERIPSTRKKNMRACADYLKGHFVPMHEALKYVDDYIRVHSGDVPSEASRLITPAEHKEFRKYCIKIYSGK